MGAVEDSGGVDGSAALVNKWVVVQGGDPILMMGGWRATCSAFGE